MSYKCWVTILQLQIIFFFSPRSITSVADSECRVIFIDVGAYGKQSDGGTFSDSIWYHFLKDFESTLQ